MASEMRENKREEDSRCRRLHSVGFRRVHVAASPMVGPSAYRTHDAVELVKTWYGTNVEQCAGTGLKPPCF